LQALEERTAGRVVIPAVKIPALYTRPALFSPLEEYSLWQNHNFIMARPGALIQWDFVV
jgi:hypothetical protein